MVVGISSRSHWCFGVLFFTEQARASESQSDFARRGSLLPVSSSCIVPRESAVVQCEHLPSSWSLFFQIRVHWYLDFLGLQMEFVQCWRGKKLSCCPWLIFGASSENVHWWKQNQMYLPDSVVWWMGGISCSGSSEVSDENSARMSGKRRSVRQAGPRPCVHEPHSAEAIHLYTWSFARQGSSTRKRRCKYFSSLFECVDHANCTNVGVLLIRRASVCHFSVAHHTGGAVVCWRFRETTTRSFQRIRWRAYCCC